MAMIEQVAIHVDMMSTERMRKHACTGPEGDHDLPFQVFRYLSGYDEALGELQVLRDENRRMRDVVARIVLEEEKSHESRFDNDYDRGRANTLDYWSSEFEDALKESHSEGG